MARVFFNSGSRHIIKTLHYLDIYDQHFSHYRGTPVRMLEIGVYKGGSLDLWREYFGKDATIYGIDINPACAALVTPPNQVRIGSQADPHFLKSVIEEMGQPDIILDDGSHVGAHQRVSFDTLFPLLKEGGLYIIEDIQTSYWWREYLGGYRRRDTAVELVKQMIDDMHGWYHDRPTKTPAQEQISGIHIYDSIVFLEKNRKQKPQIITLR